MKTITYSLETHVLVPREPTRDMVIAGTHQRFRDSYDAEEDCYRAMLAAAPQPEPVDIEPVIDLTHVAYGRLVEAASNSKWIPKEYYANDWISDCVDFLINGHPPADAGRVAELEKALKVAKDTIEAQQNGLKWYQDAYPDSISEADYEEATKVEEALAKINEVLK